VNTVTASFNTMMGQMTEMSQGKKQPRTMWWDYITTFHSQNHRRIMKPQ